MFVYFIDVCLCDNQLFDNLEVLLHARKSKCTFSVHSLDSRIRSEVKKHFYDFKVVVNGGFHKTSKAQIIWDINVKNFAFVLAFVMGPVVKQQFRGVCQSVGACNVQCVAPISVRKIDIDSFSEEQLHYTYLVLARRDE